ncbi:MAG: orotidine 5'-phosphate decarboxylase / HUMPS family protein [Methanosarcinales archaeon]
MVDKFFLALDYETVDDVVSKGSSALYFLLCEYGRDFIPRLGVKINQDLLTGPIDKRYRKFNDEGYSIFADMKISHGYGTGRRIIKRLLKHLPIDYVTVSANLGRGILKKYVEIGKQHEVNVIAWTIHTKTSPADAERMHKQSLSDAMFNFVQIASEAGCDAAVMEARMLQDKRIRKLPIKKLVTGIRIDPSNKGTQKRVSSVEELKNLKQHFDYAVISSRYLYNFDLLGEVIDALR